MTAGEFWQFGLCVPPNNSLKNGQRKRDVARVVALADANLSVHSRLI